MISYAGLLQKISESGFTKSAVAEKLGVSSRTVAKIGKGESFR